MKLPKKAEIFDLDDCEEIQIHMNLLLSPHHQQFTTDEVEKIVKNSGCYVNHNHKQSQLDDFTTGAVA